MRLSHWMLLGLTTTALLGCRPNTPDTDTQDPGTDTQEPGTDDFGTETAPELRQLLLTPFQPLAGEGQTAQLRAQARWSDGTATFVNTGVTWASQNEEVSLVDSSGMLDTKASGYATIRATYEGLEASALLRVFSATATASSLSVQPAQTTVTPGRELLFAAWAQMSDGAEGDLGADCSWSSSDTGVAIVGAAGSVLTVAPGTTQIQADCGDRGIATSELTVSTQDPPVPSVSIAGHEVEVLGTSTLKTTIHVHNDGGQTSPFPIELSLDGDSTGPGASSIGLTHPGLGPSADSTLVVVTQYTGARPATLSTWVAVDPQDTLSDSDPTDQLSGPVDAILPADPIADLYVEYVSAFGFGPSDAGIIVTLINNGPDDITNARLWFENDQPGVSAVSDLLTSAADVNTTVPPLTAGSTYEWVFDYNLIPWGETWNTCGWVTVAGVQDPDLSNNYYCRPWSE